MMPEKYFNELLNKVNDLYMLIITDRDGVPLMQFQTNDANFILSPAFIHTFITSGDQAGKLNLGRNKCIIAMYSNYQVVQMNKLPIILTFVGTQNCNTGHILALEPEIDTYLEDMKMAVTDALNNT